MEKDKINVDVILNKICDVYRLEDKNSFKDEVELQGENIRDYVNKQINKDKNHAQALYDKQKYLPMSDRKYKTIHDAYTNPMTLSGADNPLEQFNQLNYNNLTLNWWLSISMYDNSGIFKISIDTLSQDLIKAGITPNLNNVIKKRHVQKLYSNLRPELINAMKNTQLFGGAIGIIMFDTIKDYTKAPDLELIKRAKKVVIKVYDRWQLGVDKSKVTDIMDDDYGLPEYYTVMASEDSKLTKVHHSYVMRFILREAPKIVKDLLSGWGYAEIAHIYNEMMKDQQLKSNIVSLTNKALLEVVQMSGMKGLFSALADPESQAEIEARLEMVNRYRNNNSLIFLDKEDGYNQFTFGGLSGLADLMESNKDDLCAVREMSKLLLFGDTKGGLSGNADSEYLWYQGKISGKQEEYLRRPLFKLIKYLCIMSQANEEDLEALDFKFNSIIPEKPEQKAERFDKFIDSLTKLKDNGIYDEEDVKKEIIDHADEYGIGIATYKLKSIYDIEQEQEEEKKVAKFKVRPLVHTEKYKVVPNKVVKVEKVKVVPEHPVEVEKVKVVPEHPVEVEKVKVVPKED